MDFEVRQLAKDQEMRLCDYLHMDKLKLFGMLFEEVPETFGVTLPYYERQFDVIVRDLGYTNLREVGRLLKMLNELKNVHLLLCLNYRWMAVLQRGNEMALHNCHPSQPSAKARRCPRKSSRLQVSSLR